MVARRLFWDCSHIAAVPGLNTGIERVVRELGAAAMEVGPRRGFEVLPCVTDGTSRIEVLPGIPAVGDQPWRGPSASVTPGPDDVWILSDNAWDAERLIGISPWWREGMRVLVVQYDLVPIRHPATTTPLTVALFRRWMVEAVAMADAFVSISSATANELAGSLRRLAPWREFGRDELPVVHLASTWHPQEKAIGAVEGEPLKFVTVGTVEPRKRYDLLLDAFEEHWAGGGRGSLCVVGKPGWNSDDVQERMARLAASEARFRWIADAGDAELQEEYLRASCFVSMSVEEGFGLPVVEAAAAGLPLLLSDLPVYREVAGEGAIFVAQGDEGGMRRSLAEVLNSLDTGSITMPQPPVSLSQRRWSDAAGDLFDAIAALPAPSPSIRNRWDHRAALALASSYWLDKHPGELSAQPELEAGPTGEDRPRRGHAEGRNGHRLSPRIKAKARLEIPQLLVRVMHTRNRLFRFVQQMDRTTSEIEVRVASLAKVAPTARALQSMRAEEADQLFRFEIEAILKDLDRLIAERVDDQPDASPYRQRVAGLQERLRSADRG